MMSIKVYTKYKLPLVVFSIISALTFSPSLSAVQLSAISPYDSGYNHGCDDAGISDSSDYYINQPKKGPAYHTSEFMDGYYTGFDSCSYTYEPEPYQSNNEQYSTWTLDIELTNKPFKDDSAYVKVQGPDGWENSQWYDWADIKTGPGTGLVSWSLPESDFPSGEKYRVCVSSKIVFSAFPDCNDFKHGSGDAKVSVSLSRLAK